MSRRNSLASPASSISTCAGVTRYSLWSSADFKTEIGTLVSVTTQMTVDTGSTSFSVLIPAITLTGVGDHKSFTTEGIITTHTGPNSVPSTGVHETYHFVTLKGEANFVLALLEPVMQAAKAGNA